MKSREHDTPKTSPRPRDLCRNFSPWKICSVAGEVDRVKARSAVPALSTYQSTSTRPLWISPRKADFPSPTPSPLSSLRDSGSTSLITSVSSAATKGGSRWVPSRNEVKAPVLEKLRPSLGRRSTSLAAVTIFVTRRFFTSTCTVATTLTQAMFTTTSPRAPFVVAISVTAPQRLPCDRWCSRDDAQVAQERVIS